MDLCAQPALLQMEWELRWSSPAQQMYAEKSANLIARLCQWTWLPFGIRLSKYTNQQQLVRILRHPLAFKHVAEFPAEQKLKALWNSSKHASRWCGAKFYGHRAVINNARKGERYGVKTVCFFFCQATLIWLRRRGRGLARRRRRRRYLQFWLRLPRSLLQRRDVKIESHYGTRQVAVCVCAVQELIVICRVYDDVDAHSPIPCQSQPKPELLITHLRRGIIAKNLARSEFHYSTHALDVSALNSAPTLTYNIKTPLTLILILPQFSIKSLRACN